MYKPEQDMRERITDYATGKEAESGHLAASYKTADLQQTESIFS